MLSPGPVQTIPRATIPPGHATSQPARLDVLHLEESVSGYPGALLPATLRTYRSGHRRYLAFCSEANIQPVPLTEHTLCMFAAYLAKEGLTHQSIKGYFSALCYYQILSGQGDPFAGSPFPLLQYVLRGIKHSPSQATR